MKKKDLGASLAKPRATLCAGPLRSGPSDQAAAIVGAKEGAVVLDACCGGRMFWKIKERGDVLFMDVRRCCWSRSCSYS